MVTDISDTRLIADVKTAFPDLVMPESEKFYSDVIYVCRDIYGGSPAWRSVKKSGLYSGGLREMSLLNAAKVLCDELAALTFSEKTAITVSDGKVQDYVNAVLNDNGFYENMPQFLSAAYAMGGGAVKCYVSDGKAVIDYLRADCFVPSEYNNRRITSGVFRSVSFQKGFYYTLFEHYSPGNVEYKLFKSSDKSNLGMMCELSEVYDIPDNVNYDTDVPMFAYFHPAVSNNLDSGCLGLSVFANSTDTLKALDVAFDSFSREFILGRKRIIVPSSSIRTVVDTDTGNVRRYFDSDDEVYQALRCDEEKDLKITDNTMSIRVSEHVESINALLDTLCFQAGLSEGYLSFSGKGGMKTATEVVAENSKTFRTAKSHKNMLEEFLIDMVKAVAAVGAFLGECPALDDDAEICVSFADDVIEDDASIIDNNIKLVQAGLKSKLSAIMDIQKCDEDTAREELERINAEETAVIDDGAFDPSENPAF